MRVLRYLFAIALVLSLARVAKADDFGMVVVDPYTGPYSIYPITSLSDTFAFAECEEPGQLPSGAAYDECFSGQNETGGALTSLVITIPLIAGQTVGCALDSTLPDIFADVSCETTANGYLLDFSGGSITPGEIFTIAEAGVPSGFPNAAGVFNTPEPSSIWLLSTGVLTSGFFLANWRRRALDPARL